MARARDLFPPDRPGPMGIQGIVAADVAALGDPLFVLIADDPEPEGPCPWSPRGEELPVKGDAALVLLDDQGDPWVPCWWPGGRL